MKCENCGTEITDGLSYCPHCGQSIGNSMDNENQDIVCPNCGSSVKANYRYCPFCSHDLKNKTQKLDKGIMIKGKKVDLKNLLILILLIIVIAFAASSFGGNSDDDSVPPLTVDSCVASWDSQYNGTKISLTGTANKDMDSGAWFSVEPSVTTENGEIINVWAFVNEGKVKKGDKVHITVDGREYKSPPKSISFNMYDGDGEYGKNFGSVNADITLSDNWNSTNND